MVNMHPDVSQPLPEEPEHHDEPEEIPELPLKKPCKKKHKIEDPGDDHINVSQKANKAHAQKSKKKTAEKASKTKSGTNEGSEA